MMMHYDSDIGRFLELSLVGILLEALAVEHEDPSDSSDLWTEILKPYLKEITECHSTTPRGSKPLESALAGG
jgi:hypothetical protein